MPIFWMHWKPPAREDSSHGGRSDRSQSPGKSKKAGARHRLQQWCGILPKCRTSESSHLYTYKWSRYSTQSILHFPHSCAKTDDNFHQSFGAQDQKRIYMNIARNIAHHFPSIEGYRAQSKPLVFGNLAGFDMVWWDVRMGPHPLWKTHCTGIA